MTGLAFESLITHVDDFMREVIREAEVASSETFRGSDLPLYDVVRYHLGWVDTAFQRVSADTGKRIRPVICLLSAGAAGGNRESAIPVAAAIELLHNFTLMHDDIQDRSEFRRGRPTVWQIWGEAQAINAGDATFALSQLALLKIVDRGIEPRVVAELAAEFNRVTLQIVEGQVLDLGFEQRWDVGTQDYLRMIGGKTAAIVAFAAQAGALIAGKSPSDVERFHEFGRLLGLGFQIRDDYLGIWGDRLDTGKEAGDDIRGRKRSIPIVMLIDSLAGTQRAELSAIYERPEVADADVERVTAMLDEHGIDARVQALAQQYHDEALALLDEIAAPTSEREALRDLAERLVDRSR